MPRLSFPQKCLSALYKIIIYLILQFIIVVTHIMGFLFSCILKKIFKMNCDTDVEKNQPSMDPNNNNDQDAQEPLDQTLIPEIVQSSSPRKMARNAARKATRIAARLAANAKKHQKMALLRLYGEIDAMGMALQFAYNNIEYKTILPLAEFNVLNANYESKMEVLKINWTGVAFPDEIITFEDAKNFSKEMILKINEFQRLFGEWEESYGADNDGQFAILFWHGRINYALSCFQENVDLSVLFAKKSLKLWNKVFFDYFTIRHILEYHQNVDDEKILSFNILINLNSNNFEKVIKQKEEYVMSLAPTDPAIPAVIKSLNNLRHKFVGQMKTALLFDGMRPGELTEINIESYPEKIVRQLRCIVENDMAMQQRILHSTMLFIASEYFDNLVGNNRMDLVAMIDQYPFIRQFRS